MAGEKYDVFLSYNSQDRLAVEALARRLSERGLTPFLDQWCLVPGEPWQDALEEALLASASCAVFIGPGDVGPWHSEKMCAALERQAREHTFRIIPVLLPGATRPDEHELPPFLKHRIWVDFHAGLEDEYPLHCLYSGIRGIAPGPPPAETLRPRPERAEDISVTPPIQPLPPSSYMPLLPNVDFVGRSEELRTLARRLCDSKGVATVAVGRIAAVIGPGGIGKTQLAVAFVHHYGYRFPGGVFWLDCNAPQAIPDHLVACGGREGMNLPGFEALPQPDQIALVQAEWRNPIPRLLVFDSVEEIEVVQQWAPSRGGCRLLITSRRADWLTWLRVQPLVVGPLPRAESLELLCRPQLKPGQQAENCPLYHDPAANELCALLDDLPLALHLAGAYLAFYGHEISPAEYLEELRAQSLEPPSLRRAAKDLPSPAEHEQSVAAILRVSYRRLDPHDPTGASARRLFALASHCAPETPIPLELLRRALPEEVSKDKPFDPSTEPFDLVQDKLRTGPSTEPFDLAQDKLRTSPAQDRHRFAEALRRLANLGLLQATGEGTFQMRHSLAEFAHDLGTEEETEEGVSTLAQAVAEMAREANQSGLPAQMDPLLPHLRQAATAAAERGDQRAGWLYNELGCHLRIVAAYAGAQVAFKQALAVDQAAFGPDHPNVARDVNNLGLVLKDLGDLAGARTAYERALAIDEAAFGPDHPNVAIRVNNLGDVLKTLGDLAGARAHYERALAIDEATLGPDHPNVAIRVNNLGSVLKAMGDLAGARAAYERALVIWEQSLGPEHPNVASAVNNLGRVLKDLGDLAGAREAFERAMAILEQSLGPGHPNVASAVNNLGRVLKDLGGLVGAREAFERALAINEAAFGPDHPEVATNVNNLGLVLYELGDLAGAREAFERALTIWEQSLGPEHLNVASAINNLGCVLYDLRDLAGAREAFERTLAIRERFLGTDHPKTQTVRRNLDNLP